MQAHSAAACCRRRRQSRSCPAPARPGRRDDGVGLAAPQVGVNVRLMVFNEAGEKGKGEEVRGGGRRRVPIVGCAPSLPAGADFAAGGAASLCAAPLPLTPAALASPRCSSTPPQIVLVNPQVVKVGRSTNLFEEGCLSFPNIYADVEVRPVCGVCPRARACCWDPARATAGSRGSGMPERQAPRRTARHACCPQPTSLAAGLPPPPAAPLQRQGQGTGPERQEVPDQPEVGVRGAGPICLLASPCCACWARRRATAALSTTRLCALAHRVPSAPAPSLGLLPPRSGFPARIFQHEYDHLDGRLFHDRMAPPVLASITQQVGGWVGVGGVGACVCGAPGHPLWLRARSVGGPAYRCSSPFSMASPGQLVELEEAYLAAHPSADIQRVPAATAQQ